MRPSESSETSEQGEHSESSVGRSELPSSPLTITQLERLFRHNGLELLEIRQGGPRRGQGLATPWHWLLRLARRLRFGIRREGRHEELALDRRVVLGGERLPLALRKASRHAAHARPEAGVA